MDLLHSRLSEEITEWLGEIINELISQHFSIDSLNKEALAKAYAESAFTGVKVLFRDVDSKPSVLKALIRTYLRSYVYMLDEDIRKFAQ